jgi:hypothetical protein
VRWSILIPTLSSRHDFLAQLLDVLLPQAEACPGIEVVALHNDGNWPLMDIRQALLDDARGEWLSFADDDDMVEADFVPAVAACLEKDPDYVAFQHAFYVDGHRDPRTVHTGINLGGWHDLPDRYVRDVTHVNPVRSSLARQAGYRQLVGGWEDRGYDWALRPLLRTQEEIPRVMYHYYSRTSGTVQNKLPPHAYALRPEVTSPAFRWHEWSTG